MTTENMHKTPLLADSVQIAFVVGATASGKSGFALSLAEKNNGIIINSDALQIYKEFSVITARPKTHETVKIVHHLYGHVSITDSYNVADWCSDCLDIIKKEQKNNKKIIIVGGTGLYIHSLIHGIAVIPEIPPDIRQQARSMTNQQLYEHLHKYDVQAYCKLHINDTQRLARAFEVLTATGRSIYDFHQETQSLLPRGVDYQGFFLNPPREKLYQQIDDRFLTMIEQGALDEVKAVSDKNRDLQGMKAVGVKELLDYFNGIVSLDQAIVQAQQASRNYAKRQVTWFKNQYKDFTVII